MNAFKVFFKSDVHTSEYQGEIETLPAEGSTIHVPGLGERTVASVEKIDPPLQSGHVAIIYYSEPAEWI
jgi:hypothetical protein